MAMSWKLRFLPVAKQSFESQVRSQTEFGNEDQLHRDGRSVVLGEHRVHIRDDFSPMIAKVSNPLRAKPQAQIRKNVP